MNKNEKTRPVAATTNVYPLICMRNLSNHLRGNPVADLVCYFSEEVKVVL